MSVAEKFSSVMELERWKLVAGLVMQCCQGGDL